MPCKLVNLQTHSFWNVTSGWIFEILEGGTKLRIILCSTQTLFKSVELITTRKGRILNLTGLFIIFFKPRVNMTNYILIILIGWLSAGAWQAHASMIMFWLKLNGRLPFYDNVVFWVALALLHFWERWLVKSREWARFRGNCVCYYFVLKTNQWCYSVHFWY